MAASLTLRPTMPIATSNPLLQTWTTRYGLPPFADVKPELFEPAFTARQIGGCSNGFT